MGLRAQYDIRHDRMLITLQAGEEGERSFWITRRQWMSLLHALPGVSGAQADRASEMPRPKNIKRPPFMPIDGIPLVESIRLRRAENGLKLMFLVDEKAVVIALDDDAVVRLREMLLQQAERAEWDPGAALTRLAAKAVARKAVRRAGGL